MDSVACVERMETYGWVTAVTNRPIDASLRLLAHVFASHKCRLLEVVLTTGLHRSNQFVIEWVEMKDELYLKAFYEPPVASLYLKYCYR